MKSWIHFLGGSVTVYLAMAACSGGAKHSPGSGSPGPTASQGGANAQNGGGTSIAGTSTPSGSGNGQVDTGGTMMAIIDDMLDPVEEADAAPATSGTRLRARYYAGEDGSRQFMGWRDTTRNEDCSFLKSEDGQLRCLPTATYASYYSDAGCSQPLLAVAKATPNCGAVAFAAPAYALDVGTAQCGTMRIWKVGAAVAPGMIYVGSPASCTGTAPLDVYAYYSTTHITPTEFVAATEQVE